MFRPFPAAMVAAALASLAFPGKAQVKREGAYWVELANGSLAAARGGRLKVVSSGTILAQGQDAGAASYTVKKQVKAPNEAEARRLLSAFGIQVKTAGGWTYLMVTPPERNSTAELALRVPRGLARASFETRGGNVEAYDIDGDVESDTRGGRIQMDRIGGSATARTGGGEVWLGKIRGSLRCLSGGGSIRVDSAGADAFFETAGGEIWARQVAGPVRASTNGGNIHIERSGGAVEAHTNGGLIDIGQAGGPVIAENTAGSIAVGSARGVRCESAAGFIKLRNVSGMLRASTNAGHILAELMAGNAIEESFLTTAVGDITVFIPSNLAVTVRAVNQSGGAGRIVSDFPAIQTEQDGRRMRGAVAEGSLNGGGPVLSISVANGSIYLRRTR